jgi:hypothetical protein
MADQPIANPTDQRALARRVCYCPVPDDIVSNASYTLGYTGSNLTTVDKVYNGITYRRTLTYTGSDLTGVSAWVEQP